MNIFIFTTFLNIYCSFHFIVWRNAGTCRYAEEGTARLRRPDSHLRPAVAVHREESDGRQSGHLHQSGRRHTRDQELHELRVQGGQHLLRMRQQGYYHIFFSYSHFLFLFLVIRISALIVIVTGIKLIIYFFIQISTRRLRWIETQRQMN